MNISFTGAEQLARLKRCLSTAHADPLLLREQAQNGHFIGLTRKELKSAQGDISQAKSKALFEETRKIIDQAVGIIRKALG